MQWFKFSPSGTFNSVHANIQSKHNANFLEALRKWIKVYYSGHFREDSNNIMWCDVEEILNDADEDENGSIDKMEFQKLVKTFMQRMNENEFS